MVLICQLFPVLPGKSQGAAIVLMQMDTHIPWAVSVSRSGWGALKKKKNNPGAQVASDNSQAETWGGARPANGIVPKLCSCFLCTTGDKNEKKQVF